MVQLKTLSFILLLGCTLPLISMSEINSANNVSMSLDAIVPTVEATILTTLVTLPQAMMYVSFQEAVAFTIHSGIMSGCISVVGYALPSIMLDCVLDTNRRNCLIKPSVIEWKKPLSVSLAILTTCFMVCINYRELTHNYGI